MIYHPAINLFEEIIEKKNTIYSGITGFIIWNIIAIFLSPWILSLLLKNDNESVIKYMALMLVEYIEEKDE